MDCNQPFRPIRVHTSTTPIINSNLKRTWIRRSDYFSMCYSSLLFINIPKIDQLASIAHTQSRALSPDLKFKGLEDFNQEFSSDFYPDWSRYSEHSTSLHSSNAGSECVPHVWIIQVSPNSPAFCSLVSCKSGWTGRKSQYYPSQSIQERLTHSETAHRGRSSPTLSWSYFLCALNLGHTPLVSLRRHHLSKTSRTNTNTPIWSRWGISER